MQLSGLNEKGTDTKIKSQRGSGMLTYKSNRASNDHEYVLETSYKDRVAYKKLHITQLMAGLCRIMREENVGIQNNTC